MPELSNIYLVSVQHYCATLLPNSSHCEVRNSPNDRHCEERSSSGLPHFVRNDRTVTARNEAVQRSRLLDGPRSCGITCHTAFAMTEVGIKEALMTFLYWLYKRGFDAGLASNNYWSSTTYAPNTANAWIVNFNNGNTTNNDKTNSYYVRCVRGGE